MITVAGVPPFHSDAIEAEQLIERQIRRDIQYRLILRQNIIRRSPQDNRPFEAERQSSPARRLCAASGAAPG
jgi:hypothetical protein